MNALAILVMTAGERRRPHPRSKRLSPSHEAAVAARRGLQQRSQRQSPGRGGTVAADIAGRKREARDLEAAVATGAGLHLGAPRKTGGGKHRSPERTEEPETNVHRERTRRGREAAVAARRGLHLGAPRKTGGRETGRHTAATAGARLPLLRQRAAGRIQTAVAAGAFPARGPLAPQRGSRVTVTRAAPCWRRGKRRQGV